MNPKAGQNVSKSSWNYILNPFPCLDSLFPQKSSYSLYASCMLCRRLLVLSFYRCKVINWAVFLTNPSTPCLPNIYMRSRLLYNRYVFICAVFIRHKILYENVGDNNPLRFLLGDNQWYFAYKDDNFMCLCFQFQLLCNRIFIKIGTAFKTL